MERVARPPAPVFRTVLVSRPTFAGAFATFGRRFAYGFPAKRDVLPTIRSGKTASKHAISFRESRIFKDLRRHFLPQRGDPHGNGRDGAWRGRLPDLRTYGASFGFNGDEIIIVGISEIRKPLSHRLATKPGNQWSRAAGRSGRLRHPGRFCEADRLFAPSTVLRTVPLPRALRAQGRISRAAAVRTRRPPGFVPTPPTDPKP